MTQEIKHHVPCALRLTHVACGRRLQPISVSAYAGRLIHVVGANDSGKSTLLARVSGLLDGEGRVELDGMPIADLSARDLAQHQSKQVSVMVVDEVVAQLATRLMLTDKLTRPLTELFGGEWQRVRLAAVFLQVWPSLNPYARLLVLDEPATGLDVARRVALDAMLKVLCQAGLIVLASPHDLNHSLQQTDDILLI